MTHKFVTFISLNLVATTSTGTAHASEGVTTSDSRDGYAYTFEDDPLEATPADARGARIRVRPSATRTLLLRPRTHFIRELFQSAENL